VRGLWVAKKTIDAFDWGTIVDSIRAGRCVPFLGAGVNASTNGYRGLPLGGEVATRLLGKLVNRRLASLDELVTVASKAPLSKYTDLVRLAAQDLARVSLHVQVRGGNPRLVQLLQEILVDADCAPSPLLLALARTPVRLIVTTNYDGLMERAFEQAGEPPPVVVVQPTDGFTVEQQAEWQERLSKLNVADLRPRAPDEPAVLYKIHGSLSAGSAEVIVSEQDYIDFLTVVGGEGAAGVPPLIASMIQDCSLLFLGYGLEDWDFRTLYKALVERLPPRDQRMSFALQRAPSAFWEEVWREKRVKIYDVDLHKFANQLDRRMRAR
jgi:hypothetical protein